jgi:hypothetical protein
MHVLVETDPPIEWHGDDRYAERWGPDHPLCHPMRPTRLLLMLASTDHGFTLNLDRDFSVPAVPVINEAATVQDAECPRGLGMKISVRRPAPD